MHAVQRGRKLLLVRRRSRFIVGRSGVVIDFAQRDAVAAPAALEVAVVAINEDALGVDDVDLLGVLVEIEEKYAVGEYVRLLIILLRRRQRLARRGARSAVAELPEKLAVARKFHDGIAARAAGQPHVSFAVHAESLQPSRPAGNVIWPSPSPENGAIGIEFDDFSGPRMQHS